MSGGRRLGLGDRRGATLVMVALSMVVVLGMGALAVDLAAAFAWRAEAQKIADSAALAGGSAYMDLPDDLAEPVARERAYDYALRHSIKGQAVDSSEVTVQVIPAERKVRVWIDRNGMPTWFARVLGIDAVDIGAMAAAVATESGSARCLKPIALPDIWDDFDNDADEDNVWDPGETWDFSAEAGDVYQRWDPNAPDNSSATGYGSELRTDYNADYGRLIQIKATDPQSEFNAEPGVFFPWRLPPDPDQAECDKGGGGNQDAGAATYRQNLCSCNVSSIQLDTPYEIQTGNMVGPTYQGVSELIEEDPNVYWDDSANGPVRINPDGTRVEVGTATPRVIKVALFSPEQIVKSGMQTIAFNNFALLFLEDQANPQAPVTARFMYFAGGEGTAGPVSGTLVRYLRLVE